MKKRGQATSIFLFLLAAATVAFASSVLARVGGKNLTAADVDRTIDRFSLAADMGFDMAIPSEEEALRLQIRQELLEEEFEKQNIRLTPEEEEYAENYLNNYLQTLEEAKKKGGSQKESAETALAMIDQYLQAGSFSMEEYAALIEEELSFQVKYGKLIAQDSARLEKELERQQAEIAGSSPEGTFQENN